MFSCDDGNHKKPATETSPKTPPKKQKITRYVLKCWNPPATAESIENPATETINKRPKTTESITKNNDGNH